MRRLLFLACLLTPSLVSAQCLPELLPKLAPWVPGTPPTSGTAQVWFAQPPVLPAEAWGHVTYPITYAYPDNATSVSLITLRAETLRMDGWQLANLGYPVDRRLSYVVGASGAFYPWQPNGVSFVWYHIPDVREVNGVQTDGHSPQAAYYVTIQREDSVGITGENLSVPLMPHEAVILGVNVKYPYPEPIRVETQLHMRVCR